MADDQSEATDNVEIVLRGPDGKVKAAGEVPQPDHDGGPKRDRRAAGLLAGHVSADAHGDRDRSGRGGGG